MKKILIVEDEKPMSRALELKLLHENFSATPVFNGEEALAAIDKEKYDLIVCDLVMPKMDGFHFLEAVRDHRHNAPIVILSNLGQEEDRRRVLALGAKEFFVKSDTPIAIIVERIKALLS